MSILNYPIQKFNEGKAFLWKQDNPAAMLTHTSAIAWALGSAAQITGMYFNDKLDDQRKFLVPQEAADAAGNIALYYVVTLSFIEFVKGLFEHGRLRFQDIETELFARAREEFLNEEKILEFTIGKQRETDEKKIEAHVKNKIKRYFERDKKMSELLEQKNLTGALEKFNIRVKGAGVIAALVAGVISSNILTPYLRNYIAARAQEKTEQHHRESTASFFALQMQNNSKISNLPAFVDFIV